MLLEPFNRVYVKSNYLTPVSLAVISFAIFSFLILSKGYLYGNVSYFHMRYISLMASNDHSPFVWLPYTDFENGFINHHYLWHYLLVVFYCFGGEFGVKIAIVLFNVFLSLIWVLLSKRFLNLNSFLLLLVFIFAAHPLHRFCMIRVQSASLLFLMIIVYCSFFEKKKIAFFFSFIYPWLYTGSVIAILFSIVTIVIGLFNSSWIKVKSSFFYILVPSLLGMLLHPLFPGNVLFIWNYFDLQVLDAATSMDNAEYAPHSLLAMLLGDPLALFGSIISFFLVVVHLKQRVYCDILIFSVLSIFLFLLTIRYNRFIEYLHPFSLIVFLWCLEKFSLLKLKQLHYLVGALVVMNCILCMRFFDHQEEYLLPEKEAVLKASAYLAESYQYGEIIYNARWSHFDMLFYGNSDIACVAGIDTKYLYKLSPYLYNVYIDPRRSDNYKANSDIADVFKYDFNAKYALVGSRDDRSKLILSLIQNSYSFDLIFYENGIYLFRII